MPADTRSSAMPPGISVPTSGQDLPGPALWISSVSTPRCKFAHKSSVQGTDTYAVHTHPFYEIVYVLSGDVEFMVGDHPFPVGEHTLVAFPPELRHGALIRPDRPYERYTLHFDASCLSMERRMLLQEVFPSLPPASDPGAEAGCVWRSMRSSGVLQCLEAMETLNRVSGETAAMLLPIHVEALLATLYAVQQVRGTAVRHEAHPTTTQQDLVLWVEQHYTDNITLESLSERFFLSRGYINTLFRQATGSTVKAYVLKRRMNYVQMLLSAGLPAAQAANRAGFEDYTTFYRAYIRAFGYPPSVAKQASHRNDLLAEALSSRRNPTVFSPNEIIYPEDGMELEDPSMRNAIQLPAGKDPDSYHETISS